MTDYPSMDKDAEIISKLNNSQVATVEVVNPDEPRFVVGIGASAGGLESIELLFDKLPPNTGMAFVIVQHLSPDFKSVMDQLVRRHTEMAVFRVEDGMRVQRDSVYVLPAGKEIIVSQGRLLLTEKDANEALTLPIDHFFRSLADDYGSRAVAIVLSGSGSDGSRGIRDIHSLGGLVIAQDSLSAAFDSMPRSAEETGVVDVVASPCETANILLKLVNHPLQSNSADDGMPIVPEDGIKRILRVIRDNYGIDFSHYKPTTVIRRIERRLLLNHADDLEGYVDLVISDTKELNLLYKDLLIGVTQFFRDVEAFELLERKIIPELLLHLKPDQELRIWSAACATGEEAYSIAILLHERLTMMQRPANVRLFATDVHRLSLDTASTGVYDDAAIANVSPARLKTYFTKTREGYRVSQDLRNMVVFAPHNLIKDAPFTRIDLILCRNMMIYLLPLAQKRLLSLFHFALRTGGTLMLGPSETPGDLADEFETINSKWRLYRKRRDIRLPTDFRMIGSALSVPTAESRLPSTTGTRTMRTATPTMGSDRELIGVYDAMLSQLLPSAMLIDERNQLVHSFGSVSELLRFPEGRPSSSVVDMLPTDLRTVVVGAMARIARTRQAITYSGVPVNSDQGANKLSVTVSPIQHRVSDATYTLISFAPELDSTPESQDTRLPALIDDVSRERIDLLENELRHSKESLQATIEELESSNEEMQATNEEMVASNEELQSTNEELHSVNEELYTVNAEYQKKIDQLTELTHDMDNLLNSTDVHTLFLDNELRIRKFTPQIATQFNLIPTDVGRHIEGFCRNIPCDRLIEKLQNVLSHGQRHEEEIKTADNDQFLLRILPYRGETNREGVVFTLLDITEFKEAESRFRATFDNAAVGIAHVELNGRWLRVNDRLCGIIGYQRDELLQRTFQDITFADDVQNDQSQFAALKRGEIDRYGTEKRYVKKDDSLVWISLTVSLQRDNDGEPHFAIAIVQDISQRKTIEHKLGLAVTQRDQFLATLSHELRNPLAAVRHSLAILRHARSSNENCEGALTTVERQSSQMAHLLDDLLDVSRITQNKIHFHMKPLDFRDVVRDAMDAIRPSFATREQELISTLPDSAAPVNGDEARLLQVVENVLTNACKYTPAGGRITVNLIVDRAECVLSVRDTGVGIAPEMLSHVFDLFVQTEPNIARRDGGMGLGLTLVQSLVEHHGGTIQATSEGKGCGSCFVVTLPLTTAEVVPRTRHAHVDYGSEAGQGTRIVLVEDNDDARIMLETMLELERFDVVSASDGEQGLQAILHHKPDIALVDIGLPVMDGYAVAREVRKHFTNDAIYLIALTGYGQTSDIQQSEQAGFDSHLTKPIETNELMEILAATAKKEC